MHTSTKTGNENHQKALDVVAEFLARGGKIKVLGVAVNGKSKTPTNFDKRNS